MKQPSSARNPRGVTKSKTIALRLRPDERAKVLSVAAAKGMTQSALAREAVLAGIDSVAANDSDAIQA